MSFSSARPNISWGRFILCVILFLGITVFITTTLLWDYVFDLHVGLMGVSIDPLVYVAVVAFLAYRVQVTLSEAYGGQRVLETFLSMIMMIVIGLAIAVWIDLPIVQPLVVAIPRWVHHPITVRPNPYKLAIVIIFGALALWDFWIRDLLGLDRLSNRTGRTMSSSGLGSRATTTPDGVHELGADGHPVYSVTGDAVIDLNWFFKHPITGQTIPIQNVPPRLAARVIEHLGDTTPPSDPPTAG